MYSFSKLRTNSKQLYAYMCEVLYDNILQPTKKKGLWDKAAKGLISEERSKVKNKKIWPDTVNLLPWCNHNGWLGVKHWVTYLPLICRASMWNHWLYIESIEQIALLGHPLHWFH